MKPPLADAPGADRTAEKTPDPFSGPLLVSGQGAQRRRRFLIDPDWLMEKSQAENFASLDAWHVFKGFGKPARYWRDRVQGPQLVPNPDKPHAQVLHVRRPDDRDADGATWNFPAGHSGKLTLRLRVGKHFGGAQISLTDRMFDPCDDAGEKQATFALVIDSEGGIPGGARLEADRWHSLELIWTNQQCAVALDSKPAGNLDSRSPAANGLSYLRLRSAATAVDAVGFLVESVNVELE